MVAERYRRALIVGGGTMAVEHHLPRFFTHLGARGVDVFDIDAERRAVLQRRFRRNPRIVVVDTLAGHTPYDLALIATPPKFHLDLYQRLEPRCRAFLIEKPMTMTAAEAATLEAAARASNKKVFVNLLRRTLESFRLLRRLVREERFGPLQSVTVAEGGVFAWRAASLGSFSRDKNGGGVLMDTGPHTLDLLFQVFDRLVLESAHMDALGGGGAVEANCTLRLVADDRVPVTLSVSRNRHLSNLARFRFADAECEAAVRDNLITVRPSRGRAAFRMLPVEAPALGPLTFGELNDLFYERFLVPGDDAEVGAGESRKGLEILDQAYRIARPMVGGF